MGSPSPAALRMAQIVAAHAPTLRVRQFRKRRHSFNRIMTDGLVHVVHFWMAPKEPPAWTEVPGLRERHYGTFRLDFGIYVPAMNRSGEPRSEWINEYDCQLRKIWTALLPGGGSTVDCWWPIDAADSEQVAGQVLTDLGLPWLDRYPDATEILDAYDRHGALALGLSPAGALDIADLCRSRRETEREHRVLEQYVSQPVLRSHVSYLTDYLRDRHHEDLVPLVRVAG